MVTSTTLQPIKDGILLEIKVSFGAGKFEGFYNAFGRSKQTVCVTVLEVGYVWPKGADIAGYCKHATLYFMFWTTLC